jgi:hypothetical protein
MQAHVKHFSKCIRKLSRKEYADIGRPTWDRLQEVEGDILAYRHLILRTEGRETLINVILGAHGHENIY